MIARADRTVSEKLVSVTHFDQLGRVRLTRQIENASDCPSGAQCAETAGIKVQARYRSTTGHNYTLVSNPYRSANAVDTANGSTMGWTRTDHDPAGRAVEVKTFGGSSLPAPWASGGGENTNATGTVSTVHDGPFTTIFEQVANARCNESDGLGRLVRVVENPQTSGTPPPCTQGSGGYTTRSEERRVGKECRL